MVYHGYLTEPFQTLKWNHATITERQLICLFCFYQSTLIPFVIFNDLVTGFDLKKTIQNKITVKTK